VNPAPKSIVVVDDEKSYSELIRQLLSDNFDCPVHAFTNPAQALQQLAALDPAVVVTDYHMPQLHGIAFIRQASAIVPQASFLMISGHDMAAERPELTRLPALKGFLPKPFNWRKLAEEIVRAWPEGLVPPSPRNGT
jgi:DNA-binding NtrC family response regulator